MAQTRLLWAFSGLLLAVGCEPPPPSSARSEPVEPVADEPSATIAWLPPDVARWSSMVTSAAERHEVDARLAMIVVLVESRGRPDVISPAGARGLMQLMPATATRTALASGSPLRDDTELDDPARNVEIGVAHLGEILDALAIEPPLEDADVERIAIAYNGGLPVAQAAEGAVLREETRRYANLVRALWAARDDSGPPVELSAFETPSDRTRR